MFDHFCLAGAEKVLQWLFGMGGDQQVFPLMDFVASQSEDNVLPIFLMGRGWF